MTIRRLPLREFAYLDREKVEDFLSALVGGLPEKHSEGGEHQSAETDMKIGLSGSGIERKGGREEISWEEIKQATPASIFEELHRRLEQEGAIRSLDSFDSNTWFQLQNGEFVETTCDIELSALERLLDLFVRFSSFAPLLGNGRQNDKMAQGLQYLSILEKERDIVNVRILPTGAPTDKFTFVSTLDVAKLRVR